MVLANIANNLFFLLDGVSTDAMDDSKITEQKKKVQSLDGGQMEELQVVKDLEDEIRKLNHKLSAAKAENKNLLKEQEFAKLEKIQTAQDYEKLKSDFNELQRSVAEQDTVLKEQKQLQSKTSQPQDVVSLQQALLGTMIFLLFFIFSVFLQVFAFKAQNLFYEFKTAYENMYL